MPIRQPYRDAHRTISVGPYLIFISKYPFSWIILMSMTTGAAAAAAISVNAACNCSCGCGIRLPGDFFQAQEQMEDRHFWERYRESKAPPLWRQFKRDYLNSTEYTKQARLAWVNDDLDARTLIEAHHRFKAELRERGLTVGHLAFCHHYGNYWPRCMRAKINRVAYYEYWEKHRYPFTMQPPADKQDHHASGDYHTLDEPPSFFHNRRTGFRKVRYPRGHSWWQASNEDDDDHDDHDGDHWQPPPSKEEASERGVLRFEGYKPDEQPAAPEEPQVDMEFPYAYGLACDPRRGRNPRHRFVVNTAQQQKMIDDVDHFPPPPEFVQAAQPPFTARCVEINRTVAYYHHRHRTEEAEEDRPYAIANPRSNPGFVPAFRFCNAPINSSMFLGHNRAIFLLADEIPCCRTPVYPPPVEGTTGPVPLKNYNWTFLTFPDSSAWCRFFTDTIEEPAWWRPRPAPNRTFCTAL